MESIEDSEIEFEVLKNELEQRNQRLRELKEEMKDVLFEEFIENQGDFMNVDINRKGIKRRPDIYNRNIIASLYFTEEENEDINKSKFIDEHTIKNKYQSEINKASQHGYISKLGYGANRLNLDIVEFEKSRDKELEELKYNPLYRKNLYDKRIQEELEYQKLQKNMIENNDILKYFTSSEFETKFWKYVADNGGFKNGCCSKCGKVPIVNRETSFLMRHDRPQKSYLQGILTHREIHEDTLNDKGSCDIQKGIVRSGKITLIHCCKFLYDFGEKKMYKIGYPGKQYTIVNNGVTLAGQQYIPCDEYDMKPKRDLWNEINELRNEVSKLSYLEERMQKMEEILKL